MANADKGDSLNTDASTKQPIAAASAEPEQAPSPESQRQAAHDEEEAAHDEEEAAAGAPAADDAFMPQQPVTQAEVAKWSQMMNEDGISNFLRLHPEQFLRRVRRGVPPQFRWQVWKAAMHLETHEHILALDYPSLSKQDNPWTSVIEIDIARTFPELKSFAQEQQQQLWRVLNAYASYDPKLGYCQGMNFVAGLLLLVSNFQEEESFRALAYLMGHAGLAGFYGDKLPLLKRYLRACDMLVKDTVPDLREHFLKENVHAAVYLHQWFLTLFINCFPLSMVMIIWDVIVCEGLEVVLRIAVSILQVLKDSLLAMQFEEIIKFFKMMKTYDDEDGELNAFRIGQLLMKHTELIKVPPNILRELKHDMVDDAPLHDSEESPEADGRNPNTWLGGFGRVLSFFNPDATRKRSGSGSQCSASGSPALRSSEPPARECGSLADERHTRGWSDFL